MNSNFGEYVKDLRKKKGLSQRGLAIKAEIRNSTVARIEKNEVNPDPTTLIKLASALGESKETLMTLCGYLDSKTDVLTLLDTKKEAPAVSEGAMMIEDTIHSMGFEEITPALISAIAEMAVNNKSLIRARAKEIEENGK